MVSPMLLPVRSWWPRELATGAGGPTPTPRGLVTSLSAGAHPVTGSVTHFVTSSVGVLTSIAAAATSPAGAVATLATSGHPHSVATPGGGHAATAIPATTMAATVIPAGGVLDWPGQLGGWLACSWPQLAAVTATLVLLAVAGWAVAALARWSVWSADAAGGTWLEITPPPGPAAPAAAVAVWRALAGCLRRAPTHPLGGPAWLAAELCAEAGRLRAGIWVPARIPVAAVREAITGAWPGASIAAGAGPDWRRWPASVLQLCPTGGPWAPLIPTPRTANPTGPGVGGGPGEGGEPLRAVFAALAGQAPGQRAIAQLVVTTRSHQACATTAGAIVGPAVGAAGAVLGRVLGWGVRGGVRMVDELLSPPRTPATTARRHSSSSSAAAAAAAGADPERAARVSAREHKQAHSPQLRAVLRVGVAAGPIRARAHGRTPGGLRGSRRGARLRHAGSVAAGYDLAVTATTLRHRWRWGTGPDRLALRLPARPSFYLTLAEAAVLWHLPADPALYGMPAAPARVRGAAGWLPHLPHHPSTYRADTTTTDSTTTATDSGAGRGPAARPAARPAGGRWSVGRFRGDLAHERDTQNPPTRPFPRIGPPRPATQPAAARPATGPAGRAGRGGGRRGQGGQR
jgi:hypothetical protein